MPFGQSRISQIIYLVFCLVAATNFVHSTGLFNASTHATYDTSQITVSVTSAVQSGPGDIVSGIAYGAGGGLWWAINLLFNFPFPMLMIIDMGGSGFLPIALLLNGIWGLLLALGAIEILTGRDLLT